MHLHRPRRLRRLGRRTTGPSSTSAASANDNQARLSAEVSRQLADVGSQFERSLHDRFPKLIRTEIETFAREQQSSAVYNSLESTLQTVRSQLELYRIQHNDKYPAMTQLTGWSVLLHRTDALGNISASAPFGPYLQQQPCNPFTGNFSIVPTGHPTPDSGWTYNEKTGELHAVVSEKILKATRHVPDDTSTNNSDYAETSPTATPDNRPSPNKFVPKSRQPFFKKEGIPIMRYQTFAMFVSTACIAAVAFVAGRTTSPAPAFRRHLDHRPSLAGSHPPTRLRRQEIRRLPQS